MTRWEIKRSTGHPKESLGVVERTGSEKQQMVGALETDSSVRQICETLGFDPSRLRFHEFRRTWKTVMQRRNLSEFSRMITISRNGCILLLLYFLSISLFGCGDDEDAAETLVRTWELVAIDGEPLKSDQQSDRGDKGTDVANMEVKSVFGSDGSWVSEITLSHRWLLEEGVLVKGVYVNPAIILTETITVKGSYVVSGSTIELMSGDSRNVKKEVAFDWPETKGIDFEAVEEAVEQELGLKHWEEETESEFEVTTDTYTWNLEGDILTLIQTDGREEVYRKK